jgi:hypothetical protein
MDSSTGQSVRQKRGGGICFYFYALHSGRIRDIAKGIAIQSTQMGEVAKVSEVISVGGRMFS